MTPKQRLLGQLQTESLRLGLYYKVLLPQLYQSALQQQQKKQQKPSVTLVCGQALHVDLTMSAEEHLLLSILMLTSEACKKKVDVM